MGEVLYYACDKTGEEARHDSGRIEIVEFGVDGETFKTYLVNEEATALRMTLRHYAQHGRRKDGKHLASVPSGVESGTRRKRPGIREWASKVGYVIAPSGAIPSDVAEHYDRAGGKVAGQAAEGKWAAAEGASLRELARTGTGDG